MENNLLKDIIFGPKYYTITDLRYNNKLGYLFSSQKLSEFLKEKDRLIELKNDNIENLPLKTFNSKYCFFVSGEYLKSAYKQYMTLVFEDYKINKTTLFSRNVEDMITSRIFSEIEGTLNIENIPTTHKRISEIFNNDNIEDNNDIIIKNMINALHFIVTEEPVFTKENLYKLYNILSDNCLKEEDKLRDGSYYRHESVMIGAYNGANEDIIEECMDSLFAFANDSKNIKRYKTLLPHICHYYILYVHPYFDYNGRTARMVSFWLNYINDIGLAPMFMSEAINDNKKQYYEAIINTRNTNNDLTYFLGYILETASKYSLVYKNLEYIKSILAQTGDTLTSTEWGYLKKIIINNPDKYFGYKDFFGYIQNSMSKAGALKILNHFVAYGVLEKSINKKKEAIFKIKPDLLDYDINN